LGDVKAELLRMVLPLHVTFVMKNYRIQWKAKIPFLYYVYKMV
jgi:hypothetical protein